MPDHRTTIAGLKIGSNADNVLADACVRGLCGKINWDDGYAAMVKDAQVTPANIIPPDPAAPDPSTRKIEARFQTGSHMDLLLQLIAEQFLAPLTMHTTILLCIR